MPDDSPRTPLLAVAAVLTAVMVAAAVLLILVLVDGFEALPP